MILIPRPLIDFQPFIHMRMLEPTPTHATPMALASTSPRVPCRVPCHVLCTIHPQPPIGIT